MARGKVLKFIFSLFSCSILFATTVYGEVRASFEKLPECYTVSYGNPQSSIHVTEYFSLSCPKCVEFIRKDFPAIASKHVNTGDVYWTFHPDPADLLTLQAMVCFEQLEPTEKRELLEEMVHGSLKKGCSKLQAQMKRLGYSSLPIHDLSYLENTEAFHKAYAYLKQPNVPVELPTIEMNGMIYQEFPSVEWLEKVLIDLQTLTDRR